MASYKDVLGVGPSTGKAKELSAPQNEDKNWGVKHQVNIKSLKEAFNSAIQHHLSLPYDKRIENSKRAEEELAEHLGRTKNGRVKDLLGQNAKLMKSETGYKGKTPIQLEDGRGVETTGLALAPAYQEGTFNTCPNHQSCKDVCLGKTSGNYYKLGGGSDLSEFKGPRLNSLRKTIAMLRNPHAFAVKLHDEIDSARMEAESNGNKLGVRLNVLSDISPKVHESIIKAHPDVMFYDYTKNASKPIAENHHYTRSSTGLTQEGVNNGHQNWHAMRRYLEKGENVAMAFSHKKHLPEEVHDEETGKKYRVIDGDTHDYRPMDKVPEGDNGVIIGLRNKKATGKVANAHVDSKGFFVKHDPQLLRDENKKLVRDRPREDTGKLNKRGRPIYSYGNTVPTNRSVSIKPQPKNRHSFDNDGRVETPE